MNSKPNILFLHLSKTAGSSLRVALGNNFKASERLEVYVPPGTIKPQPHNPNSIMHYVKNTYSPEVLRNTRFFSAHCFYGMHSIFDQDFKYITMLRDPIERIVSHYYFTTKTNLAVRSKFKTLEDYVEGQTNQHNWMTKMVSGTWTGDLDLAKHNIKENIAFCGITEMYNESIELMTKMFNLNLKNEIRNANKDKKPLGKGDEKIKKRICELHSKDIELYNFAKDLLKSKL